jgi:hypothetical protein
MLTLIAAVSCVTPGQTKSAIANANDNLAKQVAPCFTRVHSDEPNECVHIEHVTVAGLLLDSLSWQRIPFGMAFSSDDDGSTRFDVKPSGPLVRDILNSLVTVDARYRWDIQNNVINITPRRGVPPLLDVRVAQFKRDDAIPEVLFEALQNSPEVRKRAAQLGFSGPQWFPFRIGAIDSRKFSVDCRGCTVREVLNDIVQKTGGMWSYCEIVTDGKRTYYFG